MNTVKADLFNELIALVDKARDAGFDVTITQLPKPPLAMGNHIHLIQVTENNATYRS